MKHRLKKNGTSQVYECEKNNARALTSSPFTSTHYAHQVPPRKNTSCSSTCTTQPLLSVTAIFQTLNICQISSILYCKTEHPPSTPVQKQNSKQRLIQFLTPRTDFSQKNLPDLHLIQDIP